MAAYIWYQTPLDSSGTALSDSVTINVWVGAGPPANPADYDLVIDTDADNDSILTPSEWSDFTGGGAGLNGGAITKLFDGNPGGSGTLYSSKPFLSGDASLKDDLTNNFPPVDASALVVCFVDGTVIRGDGKDVAIEDLKVRDLILTKDAGLQPIRWIGSRVVTADNLANSPELYPIRIKAGALGQGQPQTDLIVSPQHRVLVRSAIAKRIFGEDEVLVAAKHLVNLPGFEFAKDLKTFTYYHFLFDTHHVVLSNGAETESLYPGPQALKSVGKEALGEILLLFPELGAMNSSVEIPGARMLISGKEGKKLAYRHLKNVKPLLSSAA